MLIYLEYAVSLLLLLLFLPLRSIDYARLHTNIFITCRSNSPSLKVFLHIEHQQCLSRLSTIYSNDFPSFFVRSFSLSLCRSYRYRQFSVYLFEVTIVILAGYGRSAMAEILHIQLKILLHESKREKKKKNERISGSRTFLYTHTHTHTHTHTSSINHLHLRLSSNKDKLSFD